MPTLEEEAAAEEEEEVAAVVMRECPTAVVAAALAWAAVEAVLALSAARALWEVLVLSAVTASSETGALCRTGRSLSAIVLPTAVSSGIALRSWAAVAGAIGWCRQRLDGAIGQSTCAIRTRMDMVTVRSGKRAIDRDAFGPAGRARRVFFEQKQRN